ncbi:hypothetical protein [Deinococcus gobiensis]|uniref:Uncharacterized protein n=1 Tax=Deinococcus gobiensis (strain DSM 21396 / JCM 16679 / CGMCC 1.7299 / I-0) TaxID=745776 RepID=H8H3W3_DEIGI|nr:hypothetical protein [Deinococcus gobiensis]AFD28210.1 hypothetical protein DGo_PE0066 [Deinococcus gobiensis I-0]
MQIPGLEQVLKFIEAARQHPLQSTGASAVDFSENLYNVIGSTDDPKRIPDHKNEDWKPLFISVTGITDAQCYVTNDPPEKSSTHPQFIVGGHMTTDSNGYVKDGGTCYLMPLCKLHNSHDGIAFEHTKKRMLKLTGYMKGELLATFQMRMPNENPYAILYFSESEQTWKVEDYTEKHLDKWESGLVGQETPKIYIAIQRIKSSTSLLHEVVSIRLPKVLNL